MSDLQPTTPSKLPLSPNRPNTEGEKPSPILKSISHLSNNNNPKRDSGLAPSVSTMGPDSLMERPSSAAATPSKSGVPSILVNDALDAPPPPPTDDARPRTAPSRGSASAGPSPAPPPPANTSAPPLARSDTFEGITTSIPTGDFDDPFSASLSFSNRGSVFLDGRKANALFGGSKKANVSPDSPTDNSNMSTADRRLSQRVRWLYERGDEHAVIERIAEDPAEHEPSVSDAALRAQPETQRPTSFVTPDQADQDKCARKMEPWEAAGGIEDWRDVNSGDVDRYGFIKPQAVTSRTSSNLTSVNGGDGTLNPSAAVGPGSPTNRHSQKAPPDASKSSRLSLLSTRPKSRQSSRPPSRAASRADTHAASINSIRSRRSVFSRTSTLNKGRSWADEAPDMLTSASSFPGSSREKQQSPAKTTVERRREVKWANMGAGTGTSARRSHKTSKSVGGGDVFSFNMADKKVIERTWKGIPDRWRASAWYSFVTDSAKRHSSKDNPYATDETLVRHFTEHQQCDCVDDSQIDMDVPRTISGHVMFRTRYRGGQRLMFRVLRALSLEYPETGYVQGMAPLIATLLCYYDEERAFVVACRMWEYRGLAELFKPGFVGLMGALEVFEKDWLSRLPVKNTLESLGIPPMSYGTKWYLTLFCYSLPFAAQLRVWDVFMLLGGGEGGIDGQGARRQDTTHSFIEHLRAGDSTAADAEKTAPGNRPIAQMSKHGFDVLHAVSAALMDGLQEGLVGSEFENAMKLMTGSVPVGREDVLMKVVKKEWKEHRKAR